MRQVKDKSHFFYQNVSISKCNENVILKKKIFSKLSMYHIIIPFKLHISSITGTQGSFNLYCHIALQLLYVGNSKIHVADFRIYHMNLSLKEMYFNADWVIETCDIYSNRKICNILIFYVVPLGLFFIQ